MDTRLVLLGLLSLSSLSFSHGSRHKLYVDIDFPGTDITFLYSPDVEHCQLLCTQHPSCLFFTFVRSDWTRDDRHFYCYLKSTPSGEPRSQTPLQGVTSGFSLKPCNPNPHPILSQVYEDVDFLGADYKFLFTPDYEDCQRVCTQDPFCQFFTFVNGEFTPQNIRYKCHLKFSWTIPRTPIVERTVGVVSGFSKNAKITQQCLPACQTKLFPNTDIQGTDIETLQAVSAEHCLGLCSFHPRCTFFSFESKHLNCHLKNNRNELVTIVEEGFTSGLPAHFCQLDDNWIKMSYEGIDFRGSDIRFELMDDPEACGKKCSQDHNCQFYTYVTRNFPNPDFWGRCYLKRVITAPAPPQVSKLANVVSGFSKRKCVTSVLSWM